MPRISKKSQVKKSPRVSTVSFQAYAFSDEDSIHLKLPGRVVSISSDAKQPSGHPYLHAALARTFRVNRRPPDATDCRATDRGWNDHGAAAPPLPLTALPYVLALAPTAESFPAPENFFSKTASAERPPPFRGQKPFLNGFLGEGP